MSKITREEEIGFAAMKEYPGYSPGFELALDAIIIDMDGTLSDCEHRRHFVSGEKKDWKSFNESCSMDPPNDWCVSLACKLAACYDIIVVSGRNEEFREITQAWISKQGIPITDLFLRPDGDFRKDSVVKEEIYNKYIKNNYPNVAFCIDDRKQVVDMWRSLGLVCLQCAEGNF